MLTDEIRDILQNDNIADIEVLRGIIRGLLATIDNLENRTENLLPHDASHDAYFIETGELRINY